MIFIQGFIDHEPGTILEISKYTGSKETTRGIVIRRASLQEYLEHMKETDEEYEIYKDLYENHSDGMFHHLVSVD